MVKETKVNDRIKTCQDCKSQTNNPSYCKVKDTFVSRKQSVCGVFK